MRSAKGFTLVEMLLIIILVGILTTVVILIINPQEQLKKARDARRKDDLAQISKALGNYNLDNGSYPLSTSDYQIEGAPWNFSWQPYMVKAPQDPLPPRSYSYFSNGKYYQLYAKLERQDPQGCSPCGPGGEYTYGITSSTSQSLASLPAALTPTPSPQPSPSPSPAPPPKLYTGNVFISVSTPNNPQMMLVNINPFDPKIGEDQSLSLNVRDTTGAPITRVELTVITDKGANYYPMTLTSGSATNGTWAATYKVTDTHETRYSVKLVAANQTGQSSFDEIPLELSLYNLRPQ